MTHVALCVSREDLSYTGVAPVAIAPCIVLFATKINFVEFGYSFISKKRVFQFCHTVFFLEKQPEPVLWIFVMPAPTAPYPDSGVYVEAWFPGGVNQFNRAEALPVFSILHCIDIYTLLRIEHIGQIGNHRDRRDIEQCIINQTRKLTGFGHIGIHLKVDHLSVYLRGRPPSTRGFLCNYLAGKRTDDRP